MSEPVYGPHEQPMHDMEIIDAAMYAKFVGDHVPLVVTPPSPGKVQQFNRLVRYEAEGFQESCGTTDMLCALADLILECKVVVARMGAHYAWPEIWRSVVMSKREGASPNDAVDEILKRYGLGS